MSGLGTFGLLVILYCDLQSKVLPLLLCAPFQSQRRRHEWILWRLWKIGKSPRICSKSCGARKRQLRKLKICFNRCLLVSYRSSWVTNMDRMELSTVQRYTTYRFYQRGRWPFSWRTATALFWHVIYSSMLNSGGTPVRKRIYSHSKHWIHSAQAAFYWYCFDGMIIHDIKSYWNIICGHSTQEQLNPWLFISISSIERHR